MDTLLAIFSSGVNGLYLAFKALGILTALIAFTLLIMSPAIALAYYKPEWLSSPVVWVVIVSLCGGFGIGIFQGVIEAYYVK